MIGISITEKAWDGVRPSSVKKTGLSEAIRSFIKVSPKGTPGTPKAFDDVTQAIMALSAAIAQTEAAVKKATDDKKGAAAKLKAWKQECAKAAGALADQRVQLGVLKASVEADNLLKTRTAEVDEAIRAGKALVSDIGSGKLTDAKKIAVGLQDLRNVMRDGIKVSQKDGFAEYIRTQPEVRAWGVDPKKVPLPPNAKLIKAKLPLLEKVAEQARIAATQALEQSSKSRTGSAADLAKGLVADYRNLGKTIKSRISQAKQFSANAKGLGDKFKAVIAKNPPHDKLLGELTKFHAMVLKYEDICLKDIARGRVSSGDIQAKRIKLRNSLDKDSKEYREFEAIASQEWNLIMVTHREVSEELGKAYQQVDRVARLVGAMSPAAKTAAASQEKKFAAERQALRNKYQ